MMKKIFRYAAIGSVLVVVLGFVGLLVMAEVRRAAPAEEALAALESDPRVSVSEERWLVYRPAGVTPTTGVILYPGASCDVRGYAPVLLEVAAQGYLVVNVSMPFDFAIFAPRRAGEVQAEYPEIRRWVLIGHSMGGAMAAQFVHEHPDAMAGLILWDSYPPAAASLAELSLPVWNIHRATPDGAPPESFAARRPLYPPHSRWVPIAGGNHMNFGAFVGGAYQEQWAATISRAEQHAQVIAATLQALHSVEAGD